MDVEARLDYEGVVAEYWDNLNTMLRGFRPAADYLDLWVPDEDHVKSIINMIEAAQMDGQSRIGLYLGPKTLGEIDIEQLKTEAAEFGKVQTVTEGEGLVFEVTEL